MPPAAAPRRWQVAGVALVGLVVFLSLDFVGHSLALGWRGLTRDLSAESRLYWPEAPLATAAMFLHMVGGAALTVLAPVQLVGPIRRRWPRLHRRSGYLVAGLALVTGAAGLFYIGSRGTVGGPEMSVAFALYGAALAAAGLGAVVNARSARFDVHRRWALRLAVLALGSWIYRMHYGIWFVTTGGTGVEPDFSGLFDRVNIWAFYVPYLVLLELVFLRERRRAEGLMV